MTKEELSKELKSVGSSYEEFEKACLSQKRIPITIEELQETIKVQGESSSILLCSLSWRDSEQGNDYWTKVYNRLYRRR